MGHEPGEVRGGRHLPSLRVSGGMGSSTRVRERAATLRELLVDSRRASGASSDAAGGVPWKHHRETQERRFNYRVKLRADTVPSDSQADIRTAHTARAR